MKLRFRIILPMAYVGLSGILLIVCFLHLGHSVWCDYFLQSMFPASLLHRVVAWLFPSLLYSSAWQILDTVLTVVLPYLLTVAQYFLLGKLIDYFFRSRPAAERPREGSQT